MQFRAFFRAFVFWFPAPLLPFPKTSHASIRRLPLEAVVLLRDRSLGDLSLTFQPGLAIRPPPKVNNRKRKWSPWHWAADNVTARPGRQCS